MRVSLGRASHGYLTGVYNRDVHLMGVAFSRTFLAEMHLIGVHFVGVLHWLP